MVLNIIITLIAVVILGIAINYFEDQIHTERNKMSIKESMDLAQIPIVTFQEGDLKFNFLLDSGSSQSHISSTSAKTLVGTPIDVEYAYITAIGSDNTSKVIESILTYKGKEFKVNFLVNEGLNDSFKQVKEECGVQLHGILGADFLRENRYVLDFAELVAYHK